MCRRVVLEHGGRPPGSPTFYRSTGLTITSLHDVGIRSYGDLCELAGYPRNQLRAQLTPDELLRPLAELTVRLGHFPNKTDREMARRADQRVPSYEAYRTAETKQGSVVVQLLDWCAGRPEFASAQDILRRHIEDNHSVVNGRRSGKLVLGHVYLFRYGAGGRHFKIGMSDDVKRRNNQSRQDEPQPGSRRTRHRHG